ncbi:hypothetical protein PAMA_005560 [Pampus argenteus]
MMKMIMMLIKYVASLEDEENEASATRKELVKQNCRLQEKLTALEGFSQRQNIRITGVTEGTERPDLGGCLKTLLSEALGIDAEDLWFEMDRVNRVGSAAAFAGDSRPRHIIVRFFRDKAQACVLAAARKKKQIDWNGMRVCFVQDYAQEIQEKRRKFDKVRCLLQHRNILYSLRFPAIMTFSVDNQQHQFSNPAEAKQFISGLSTDISGFDNGD